MLVECLAEAKVAFSHLVKLACHSTDGVLFGLRLRVGFVNSLGVYFVDVGLVLKGGKLGDFSGVGRVNEGVAHRRIHVFVLLGVSLSEHCFFVKVALAA